MRAIVRHRQSLTQLASQAIEHMRKSLDQMNLHLHHVISDIAGETGLRILDAIVNGERDVRKMAKLRDRRIRSSEKTLMKALTQIADRDQEITRRTEALEGHAEAGSAAPEASKALKARGLSAAWLESQRHEYYRLFGVDLTAIDGIGIGTLQTLATEVGPNLSRFRSAAAFTSRAGLTSQQEISGGKLLRSKTAKNKNRVAYALRMAASALLRSRSALGDEFRRLRTKLGAPKAITAMARRLGCLIYNLITRRTEFDPRQLPRKQERYQQRHHRRIVREAAEMGYDLIPKAAQPMSAGA